MNLNQGNCCMLEGECQRKEASWREDFSALHSDLINVTYVTSQTLRNACIGSSDCCTIGYEEVRYDAGMAATNVRQR